MDRKAFSLAEAERKEKRTANYVLTAVTAEVHCSDRTIRVAAMIDNNFWKAAASVWSWEAEPDIHVKTGSGGKISEDLLNDEDEFFDFDDIDFEASMSSMFSGGNVVLKDGVESGKEEPIEEVAEEEIEELFQGILLDLEVFDEYLEQENIEGFSNCFKMLRDCGLPEEMTERYKEMVVNLEGLKNTADKFQKIYQADISLFMESYIPEALNLSIGYVEYVNASVNEEILQSTRKEIVEVLDTLLIG